MDVPRYLPYLMDRFLNAGGRAFRVTLPSLASLVSEDPARALEPFPRGSAYPLPVERPAAVINCAGLGALTLGDVLGGWRISLFVDGCM